MTESEANIRIRVLYFLKELGDMENDKLVQSLMDVYHKVRKASQNTGGSGTPLDHEAEAVHAIEEKLEGVYGENKVERIRDKFGNDLSGDLSNFEKFLKEIDVESWGVEE